MKNQSIPLAKVRLWAIAAFLILFLFNLTDSFAQPSVDYGGIESEIANASNSVKTIVNYILGAIVILGLIFVIYAVVNNSPQAKNFVIAWFVAVVIWIIAWKVI